MSKPPESPAPVARYAAHGLCAIDPKAFGLEFALSCTRSDEPERAGELAVVRVSGPLTHAGWLFESYDGVVRRFEAALASDAPCVCLHIGSPGGDVYGAFDAARKLRDLAAKAGKRFIAFTDTCACSSAYALASGAERLYLTDTAEVGSVGVIATRVDASKADAAQGLSFAFITSGERKADGNPHLAMSDAEREATQVAVDETAAIFFALVKAHRGLEAKAFQAGKYVGARAVAVGLADEVASWDELCAQFATPEAACTIHATMAYKTAKEALTAEAAGSDAKAAAAAKRALAAMDQDDNKDKDAKAADEGDDKPADKPKDAKSAKKAEFPPAKDDEKDDKDKDAKAAESVASLTQALAAVSATVNELAGKLAARDTADEAAQREALFASAPTMSKELRASVEKLPLEQARAIVNALPKAAGNPFVTQPRPLQGASNVDPAALTPDAITDPNVRRAFGFTRESDYKSTEQVAYNSVMQDPTPPAAKVA